MDSVAVKGENFTAEDVLLCEIKKEMDEEVTN